MIKKEWLKDALELTALGLLGVFSIHLLKAPKEDALMYNWAPILQVFVVLAMTHARHWLFSRVRYKWSPFALGMLFSKPWERLRQVFVAPFLEVLVFQGTITSLLEPPFVRYGYSPLWAVGAQAAVFALYQVLAYRYPHHVGRGHSHWEFFGESFVDCFVGGVIFGMVYCLTGNMWLVVLSRAFYNAVSILLRYTVVQINVVVQPGEESACVFIVDGFNRWSVLALDDEGDPRFVPERSNLAETGMTHFDIEDAERRAGEWAGHFGARAREYTLTEP